MTARVLPFPNFFRPATPRDEPCVIYILPRARIKPPKFEPVECPKIALLRARSKMLREHFKANLPRGTYGGGDGNG